MATDDAGNNFDSNFKVGNLENQFIFDPNSKSVLLQVKLNTKIRVVQHSTKQEISTMDRKCVAVTWKGFTASILLPQEAKAMDISSIHRAIARV